jgi:hypothetical protein
MNLGGCLSFGSHVALAATNFSWFSIVFDRAASRLSPPLQREHDESKQT